MRMLTRTSAFQTPTDYERIAQTIAWIEAHVGKQPTLDNLARQLDLSPLYTQRLFARWAGVSPKRFLELLTAQMVKKRLGQTQGILNALHAADRFGLGRHHDHTVHVDRVTREEYRLQETELTISYGIHSTLFGECLLAVTKRGITHMSFSITDDSQLLVQDLCKRWPRAILQRNMRKTAPYLHSIFSLNTDRRAPRPRLFLRGTPFELTVWEALVHIPAGHLATYQQIANAIDRPNAARAVGNAVGANPVAFLIPCHRVIQSTGATGNYRWGTIRKKAMLAWEFARCR